MDPVKLSAFDPGYPNVAPFLVEVGPPVAQVLAGDPLPSVEDVETAALVASLVPVNGLFSAESIPWKTPDQWVALVAAAVNNSWGVHDLCTLTACRHPLHPGPCKGWKHTLHTVSPGAYHALEKARVEKLNAKRVAKIEALKAQGKPIPKSLLKPITYDPNALKAPPEPYGPAKPATTLKEHAPHLAKSGMHTLNVKAPPPKDIGKSAELVGGEAHHASEQVSKDAGIKASHPPNPHPMGHSTAGTNGTEHHGTEPGKVTLGEVVKPAAKTPTESTKVEKHAAYMQHLSNYTSLKNKAKAAKGNSQSAKAKEYHDAAHAELDKAKEHAPSRMAVDILTEVQKEDAAKLAAQDAAKTAELGKVIPKVDELAELQKKQATNEKLSKVIHAVDSGDIDHWLPIVDGLSKDEFEKLDPIDQTYIKSALKDTAINGSNIPMQQAAMGAHEKLTGEKVAGGNKGGGLLEDLLTNGPAKLSTFSPAQNAAVDMATSKEWWAKKQLPAYEPLTKTEFQGLDKAHQDKILGDLVKGHGKFKDPAKVKATEELLTKLGHGDKIPGQPPAAAAKSAPPDASSVPSASGTVSVPKNLTDADINVIRHAHTEATRYLGLQALLYGTTGKYSKLLALEKTDAYAKVDSQIAILSKLSGKLAVALAAQHHAVGTPHHYDAALAVDKARVDYTKQHDHVQTLINLARTQAGLTKKKLPKLTDAVHQEKAAQIATVKTFDANGEHQFTGPAGLASAKSFLHDKMPSGTAVKHLSPSDKAAAKKAAEVANSPAPPKLKDTVAAPPGDLGATDIGLISEPVQAEITFTFKALPSGKYLHDPTEDVYDNLVALAHVYGGKTAAPLSVAQVARVIDRQHSANLGVANTGMLEAKLKDWLATPDGAAYAQAHATPNKDLVSNITGEIEPPKGIHLEPGEKVQKLPGPGPFDAAKPASDFKHMSNAQVRAEQDAYMAKTGTPWSAASKNALYKYTGSMYKTYNKYLRGKSVTINAKEKKEILHIQAGMRPLQSDVLLVRGTDFTNFPPGFQDKESLKQLIGKPGFEDKAFVSTATSGGFGGDVRMEIEAPKGTMAAFLDDISGYQGENEVLLAAGTKFKVLSVVDQGSRTVVRVRVVGAK